MSLKPRYRYACLQMWARLLLRFYRFDAALLVFDEMSQLAPSVAYPLASKAHVLTLMNRKSEAIDLLKMVCQIHPQLGEHWYNLGFLQEEAADYDSAFMSFKNATVANPKIDRAWYGLGLVAIRLQRWQQAQAAMEMNTRLQPLSPYGWYQLARIHLDRHEPEKTWNIIRHLKGFEPKVAAQLERETRFLCST